MKQKKSAIKSGDTTDSKRLEQACKILKNRFPSGLILVDCGDGKWSDVYWGSPLSVGGLFNCFQTQAVALQVERILKERSNE